MVGERLVRDFQLQNRDGAGLHDTLYHAVLVARFAPVYHAVLGVIVRNAWGDVRPYDLHHAVQGWLKAYVGQDYTASNKNIGVAMRQLGLVEERALSKYGIALYRLDCDKARAYWTILSEGRDFRPLLSTLRAADGDLQRYIKSRPEDVRPDKLMGDDWKCREDRWKREQEALMARVVDRIEVKFGSWGEPLV